MTLLATTFLIALHMVALYGWGRALERSIGLANGPAPRSAAIGLALVIAQGGVLNLAGLVSRPALWALVVIGIALATGSMRGAVSQKVSADVLTATAWLVPCAVLLFVAATLVPGLGFNYHDDFQKYFVHPVRMLQTGRVAGSSLSAIGFETLGGQAFLQTFVLNVAGVDALNAVDLGLGLVLCMALAGVGPACGPRARAARGLAMTAVVVINPQIVNISSLYTGAALCSALVLLHASSVSSTQEPDRAHALVSGLMFAGLCALKTSFVLWVAATAVAWTFGAALHTGSPWRALRWSALCAASCAVCLLPWVLVHASSYLAALGASPALPVSSPTEPYSVSPLSAEVVGYGSGFAPYTVAVLICLGMGIVAFALAPKTAGARPWAAQVGLASALSLAVVYALMLYVVAPRGHGAVATLRLFVPLLIGVMPALMIVVGTLPPPGRSRWRLLFLFLMGASVIPFASFGGTLPKRLSQALTDGSVLGFTRLASRPWYTQYNAYVLHGAMRQHVAAAQAVIPAAEPLVAWINAPFWLDFRRNPITDIDLAGLETPWSAVPKARYVIWEYNGKATPQMAGYESERTAPALLQARVADAGMRLAYAMIDLARHSAVLWNDGQIMVLRLARSTDLADRYGGR